ncbi:MAG: arginine--tRNA ligase, partial [Lachnospiraceae bacterium]|nr:arginine--tRNA ligase [Lachnospiraceae bacterium]
MKKILDLISGEVASAFEACGYDAAYGKTGVSNRPDLCEYQCNGAMAAKKRYQKAPMAIANEVVEKLTERMESEQGKLPVFEKAEAVNPGFINLKVSGEYLAGYLDEMAADENLSCEKTEHPKTIIVDYGGANVAKPLHVGHLRSAIIGESVKRICRFAGNQVIGDVHLGDWGLQMGLIITEVRCRQPELPYFDPAFEGEYPKEAPFTISELEEIYPTASAKSKEDEAYKNEALEATAKLQDGERGYRALWQHILNVSVADLKKNYSSLNVEFDLWKKESDAQPYIPDMA